MLFSEKFEPFLKKYINDNKYRSIETEDFKKAFTNYFSSNEDTKKIDWQTWLFAAGMPPVIPDYNKALVNVCIALKDKWLSYKGDVDFNSFSAKDLEAMNSNQVDYFLQLMLESEPISIKKLKMMEKLYKFNETSNAEIRFRWIRIGLKAQWEEKIDEALKMVTEVGRMKYVRPLYQDMYKWEAARKRAISTYNNNKSSMMYVTAYTIKQDLHLDN